MARLQRILACLTLLALASCATPQGGRESLRFTGVIGSEITASILADRPDARYTGEWSHTNSQFIKGQYAIDEFVPKGERIEAWTRLFTLQNLRRGFASPPTPRSMMEGLRELMLRRCPGATWGVIRENPADILYEYHFANCPDQPAQHEIARILFGKWNIWRIAYTQKVARMADTERSKWIQALSEPSIVAE